MYVSRHALCTFLHNKPVQWAEHGRELHMGILLLVISTYNFSIEIKVNMFDVVYNILNYFHFSFSVVYM